MDAVKSFFAKYHAVPASFAGPQWDKATLDALVGWATEDCRTWGTTLDNLDRLSLQNRMAEIRAELWRRLAVFGEIDFGDEPTEHAILRRAWDAVCQCIGYGP